MIGQYIRITIKYAQGGEDYIECDLNDYETATEFRKAYDKLVKALGKDHLFTSDLIKVSKYLKNQTKYVSVKDVISVGTELVQSRYSEEEEEDEMELFDPMAVVTDGLDAIHKALIDINATLNKKPASKKKVLLENKKEVKKNDKTGNKI